MIAELLCVAAVLFGGCLLTRVCGVRGWALLGLGFLAGAGLQLAIGFLQLATGLPTAPAITLALTFAVPAGLWLWRWRRGDDVAVSWRAAALAIAALVAVVGLLRAAQLTTWHLDSLEYAISGALIAEGTHTAAASTQQMVTRVIGFPLLLAPGHLAGDYYLPSVTALLGAATVAAVVWFLRQGCRSAVPIQLTALIALGVLLLLSNNRFVFSFWYLNGHLLVAAMVLLIVGCGWLFMAADQPPVPALMVLQLLAIPALVITRPEGFLLAGLALLPTLLCARVAVRHRLLLVAVLGSAIVAWNGYLAWVFRDRGVAVPDEVTEPFVIGVLCLVGLPVVALVLRAGHPSARHAGRLRWLAEGALWLALAGYAVRRPEILSRSVDATIQNAVFGEGTWGVSLVVLAVLLVAVVLFVRAPHEAFLRFPVTTFVPLAFLLAYLRGEAYRVGYADSLSRMWIHILPVAVLYLVAAIAGSQLGLSSRAPDQSAASGAVRTDPVRTPYVDSVESRS